MLQFADKVFFIGAFDVITQAAVSSRTGPLCSSWLASPFVRQLPRPLRLAPSPTALQKFNNLLLFWLPLLALAVRKIPS